MKTRTKIILWTLPLWVIVFTLLVTQVFTRGLNVPWKLVGKPSAGIAKIMGIKFSQRKIYVMTVSGEIFSLYFNQYMFPAHDSSIGQWNIEKDTDIAFDPITPITYSGMSFTPPPPPFNVKQIYTFSLPAVESFNETRFALSEDGNLWFWSFAFGGLQGFFYALPLAIEILLYLFALFVGFIAFVIKRGRMYFLPKNGHQVKEKYQ